MTKPTWHEKEHNRYWNHLNEHWTAEGEKSLHVMVTPDGRQVSEPFDLAKDELITVDIGTDERISDLKAIPITARTDVPKDEAWFVQHGEIVGKITNLGWCNQ